MLIRWADSAVDDLSRIADYVGGRKSSQAARRTAIAIYDRINLLEQYPGHLPCSKQRGGNHPNSSWRAEMALNNQDCESLQVAPGSIAINVRRPLSHLRCWTNRRRE